MEKQTIVIDEPKDAGKYNSVYAEMGELDVSPTTICDILEIPEEDRPVFTVEPYSSVEYQKILQINYEATDITYDRFKELGYDYVKLLSDIKEIENKLEASGEDDTKDTLHCEMIEKKKVWERCFLYGQLRRDTESALKLVEKKTKSVKNLVYKEGAEWVRYSGPFDFEVMSKMNPEMVKWLDQELQKVSGLSDTEIAGL